MITLQDMKDIKAAVQGRTVRPDGTVDHASPALTPHLTLGIVWYDFELVGYDWLRRDGLLDVIDVVSPWVWIQSANRTADYSTRVIEKLRTYVPHHAIYAGVYVQNSAAGNPGGGVWVDPVSVRHILTQTPQLYDRGEIAGSLIFAGIWLEAATMSAKLEESFALPQLLNRTYWPYVGTAAVTIVDAANRPVAGANATVHYQGGPSASGGTLVTRRVSDRQGRFEFGGWAGRAAAVPHIITVSAPGFAPAKQPLQLKGMARVHATVKLAPKKPADTASSTERVAKPLKTDGVDEVTLDGDQWRFELDDPTSGPGGDGLRPGLEWYRPEHPEPADSIRVPGSWGSQGFGQKNAAYRYAWSGVGWYFHNFSVPAHWCGLDDTGSDMELTIGGVMRRGRVWLDGVELGAEHIGYLDEWHMPLERTLICGEGEAAGRHDAAKRLVVRVDNRANHSDGDCFSGCLDLRGMEAVLQVADEHTPLGMEWGGIWDHVRVRRWPTNSVSDIFVYPAQPDQVIWGTQSVDLLINVSLREPATASTRVNVSLAQNSREGDDAGAGAPTSGSVVIPEAALSAQLKLVVTSPQLWSPSTPYLYTATAGDTEVKFGIKHLTTSGSRLLLNGASLYVHGVGDDFTYLESESPPLDKELYRERLLKYKSFGFNFVRLHSHFEASEYMEAAAEVGMLLSPALPMGAKNGSQHCNRLDLAEAIYRRTWTSLILKYRNNPSLMDYSMGNEYYGMPGRPSFPFRESFYAIAKRLDPYRLVIDTDGCCWQAKGCGTGGTCNRATNDFMVQFMGYTDNLADPAQFADYDQAPPKPIISHEAGDFNAMQDLSTALAPYTEEVNALPLSLAPAVAELRRLGLLEESAAWTAASGALYVQMWKLTVEDMRTRAGISGYAWWTAYSYPGCAQGLLTADFQHKAVLPAQLLPFNSDAVLLLAGLPRVYAASTANGDNGIVVQLSVSNFLPSQLLLSSSTVQWNLAGCDDSSKSYGSGTANPKTMSAAQGAITPLAGWTVRVPAAAAPTCLSLQVALRGGSCAHCSNAPTLSNDWSFMVLPEAPPVAAVVYADAGLVKSLRGTGVFADLRPLPNTSGSLTGAGATYIVKQLTPQLQTALNTGATVLCIECPASGGGVVAYGPGLWATMGPGGARGVGTFVPPASPLGPLARAGEARWLDKTWYEHVEGALVQDISASSAEPLIRWINNPCAYSGPISVFSPSMGGNRTFPSGCQGGAKLLGASYALLSTTAVGDRGGRLLWSGLKLFPNEPTPPPPPAPAGPPTLGFCSAGNVSACETAVRGSFLGDYSPDHEHVELHIATSEVAVDAIFLDMQGINPTPINPACNPHQQDVTVRGVIYTDLSGRPGKLVAASSAVTIDKSAARSFVRLELPEDVTLPAGKYWLGNHIGSVCAVMWGSPSSAGRNPCVYGKQPFADGPSPNFPTEDYGTCSGALSVFATFRSAPTLSSPERTDLVLTPWILSLLLNKDQAA